MTLTTADVKHITYLSRLAINPETIPNYVQDLSDILDLVIQMNRVDTIGIEPMAHPLETSQRLRPDEITEVNQREIFQSGAPEVEAGIYLVPKVID
ncbi:glutamyl-tRNA(Gln) amidotransferase subunit C [Candidatus Nitrosoglobus terrae]|uniref:Aspartyl/glutamyl-tRNA(Asn/Gln) amidotransferase subunit C n=1 Tax=Candidatus Nitrosoglobus terrae TaxID=1630141 RepID=A0A1Q2SLF4_9GAMM|nr:Asp-tRNA(Asn)/Glu-tRNA(Gln) amidotransferase subunit GatC [Candidatus Nitrosoglobus terrae]BAW79927.1 glutamyl-tRNA(Gln) amidotransferase subunit C [Candidatus Nitrosoglobus terrae]